MSAATTLNPKADGDHFPSLASLRSAHSDLLKLHRERGNQPEVLAEIEQLIHKGRATGAVLDSEDDRWAAQSLLDYWSSLLYRAGQEPPDTTLVDFDPSLAPNLSDDLCPYMGLEAFREKNQNLFFGRQRLINKLLKHLENNRLLIVVGSSGSGKSSIVLAGLLPRLLAGAIPSSQDWFYYPPLVPGSDPLAALAWRLKPQEIDAKEWIPQQISAFKQNPNHLVELVEQLDYQPVVLVIDQFEEVFTLCRNDEDREAFIKNLLNLIQSATRHILILTMRTDFESQFVRTPDLLLLFEQSHIRVTALDAGELRETIEKPAEMVGLKFDEGLVDALLGDVLGEPAALPLLQFTLLKLWDNRDHNRVTWEAYRRLEGGRLALAKSADEFYNSLIPEEQLTAKRILLRMVRPSEGLEVTSNRISRKELYLSGEARDRVDRVLDKLIQARLIRLTEGITFDYAQVEVAHEALIRNWPQLVNWLEDERTALRQRLRLTIAAEQWQAKGRDSSALLRGVLLTDALSYQDLNKLETEFIQKGLRGEKIKRYLLIGNVTVGILCLICLCILSIFAFYKAKLAEQQLTEVNLILKANEVNQAPSPEEGLVLMIQIVGQSQEQLNRVPLPVQDSLRKAIEKVFSSFQGVGSTVAVFSPNGKTIATAGEDGTVRLWSSDGTELAELKGHTNSVTSVAFSPDGKTIATAGEDGTVRLWSSNGKLIAKLLGHAGSVTSVAFSPDGKTIATAGEDGTVRLWSSDGTELAELRGHTNSVTSVAFSPDGKTIATASLDNTVRLWNIATSQSIGQPLIRHQGAVTSVAISPDGKLIVTGSLDGTVRLWDVATGQPVGQFRSSGGSVTSVGVSPDVKNIISTSRDGITKLWDLQGNVIEEFSQGVEWKTLLSFACNGLRDHPILATPQTQTAREAKAICQEYVWSQNLF